MDVTAPRSKTAIMLLVVCCCSHYVWGFVFGPGFKISSLCPFKICNHCTKRERELVALLHEP